MIPYNISVLLYAEITTLITNFVLSYNDLFVIVVSVTIFHQFQLLHARIKRAIELVGYIHPSQSFAIHFRVGRNDSKSLATYA